MKKTETLQARYVTTPQTKVLLARVTREIPSSSYLVFRRDGDAYRFEVIEQSGDTSDPIALASFIAPDDVDAGEAFHAACLSLESDRAKKKPRKRRNAAASRTGGVKA